MIDDGPGRDITTGFRAPEVRRRRGIASAPPVKRRNWRSNTTQSAS